MNALDTIKTKAAYYASTLKSYQQFGGNSELARGVARIALKKPSDLARKLRWKLMTSGTNVERILLDFEKFKLAVDAHDEGISAELALDHMHEPIGTKILLSILQPNMTLVELGANIGYYTMQEAAHKPLHAIHAIEPNPVTFGLLSENVQLNQLNNIHLYNLGISDIDGNIPFYITKHSNICSCQPRAHYEQKIDVPVLRLDSLVQRENIQKIDMIRMDIEGHETNALRGMIETLKRDHPWICMEYHAPMISEIDREAFVTTLEDLHYELKCFTFRWVDMPIFGRTIVNPASAIKQGNLRETLSRIPSQVLLLFLAPKDTPFQIPNLHS